MIVEQLVFHFCLEWFFNYFFPRWAFHSRFDFGKMRSDAPDWMSFRQFLNETEWTWCHRSHGDCELHAHWTTHLFRLFLNCWANMDHPLDGYKYCSYAVRLLERNAKRFDAPFNIWFLFLSLVKPPFMHTALAHTHTPYHVDLAKLDLCATSGRP